MATYWKTKVLPGINKIFDKDGKKAAAVEFLKSFNKEELGKEIEDKKTDLEPKVAETYEASPPEVKALFKDKKPVKISKKNSAAATKFLDELAKIGNNKHRSQLEIICYSLVWSIVASTCHSKGFSSRTSSLISHKTPYYPRSKLYLFPCIFLQ
uniref:Uncharacterized protein n=1 Tax=Setaria italica TaxID=4555 RepID=K3XMU8_SETIT